MSNDRVELTVQYVMQSENAVLFEFTNARGLIDQKWFPKSQLADKRRINETTYSVTIPQWLAEDRGVV